MTSRHPATQGLGAIDSAGITYRELERVSGRPRGSEPLLAPDEPPPSQTVNVHGKSGIVITCDHASNAVPRRLGCLGLDAKSLQRHIGWDIGSAEVAVRLARQFDAPAVLSGYSRLVIDCNRPLGSETSIPEHSDGTPIPGNIGLSPGDALLRATDLFLPYHKAIETALERVRQAGATPVLIAVHSFTAKLNGGPARPWHFGVLWDEDARLAGPLIAALGKHDGIVVGDNEPYSARDHMDFSQGFHAASRAIPSALVEVRDDLISDPAGVATYTDILGDALENAFEQLRPAMGAR